MPTPSARSIKAPARRRKGGFSAGPKIFGVADIGSNSTHLLVAVTDGVRATVDHFRRRWRLIGPQLAEGVLSAHKLTSAPSEWDVCVQRAPSLGRLAQVVDALESAMSTEAAAAR